MFEIDILKDAIHGDKLADMADVSINAPKKSRGIVFFEEKAFEESMIIFCKTDFLQTLFNNLKDCKVPHVLITHNSDQLINEDVYNTRPDCIKRWYAENVDYETPDLIPIPLGVERPDGMGYSADMSILRDQMREEKKFKNLVYTCHNKYTNRAVRGVVSELHISRPWITHDEYGVRFNHYIDQVYNHMFTLCPRGNGYDTHRLWECLYLGNIPVTDNVYINRVFAKTLPIILIDDWSKFNLMSLMSACQNISNVNLEPLKIDYWINLIKKDFDEIKK